MKKPAKTLPYTLPLMVAGLVVASWATIFHRSVLMARGTCSAAEYQRMMAEKAAAVRASVAAVMTGRGHAAVLAPFATRARANMRRLSRKA